MATWKRTKDLGLFDGPWPRDNTSDFEYDSPPGSPALSSGYESASDISEYLDLYEDVCVFYFGRPLNLMAKKNASKSGLGIALTDDQISALNEQADDFRAASYEAREEIVEDFLGSFKSARTKGVKFDEVIIRTVCAPSATEHWAILTRFQLIRQHLYGNIRPGKEKPALMTRRRMVEER